VDSVSQSYGKPDTGVPQVPAGSLELQAFKEIVGGAAATRAVRAPQPPLGLLVGLSAAPPFRGAGIGAGETPLFGFFPGFTAFA